MTGRAESYKKDRSRRTTIGKNQNTYAKLQREIAKKEKAEAKRARRNKLKQGSNASDPPAAANVEEIIRDDERETPDEAD